MSTAQFTTPLITVIPGQLISASLWNGEFVQLFNNINPSGVGAYSDTDPQMQTATDPFPSGTSRPTSLAGELERIRFQFVEIVGGTYWYNRPADTIFNLDARITAFLTRFPVQTSDIGALQVTDAKINDVAFSKVTGTVTPSDGTVTTAKIVNANVTDAKITAVAASKITGQIVTSQITDANVTAAKLASGVNRAVGMKSINTYTVSITVATGTSTTTKDTAISAVDNTQSCPILIAMNNTAGDAAAVNPVAGYTISFTSTTNLRIVLNMANVEGGGHNTTWSFTVIVIEFN